MLLTLALHKLAPTQGAIVKILIQFLFCILCYGRVYVLACSLAECLLVM